MAKLDEELKETWIVTSISGLLQSRTQDPRYAGKPYRTIRFVNGANHKLHRKTYVTQGMVNEQDWDPVFNSGVGTVLTKMKLQGPDRINGDSSETMQIEGRLTQRETDMFLRTGMVNPKPETSTFGNGLFDYAS